MILPAEQIKLIRRGTKTTIRLPVDDTYRRRVIRGRTRIQQAARPRPDQILPVRRYLTDGAGVALRLLVLSVGRETHGSINQAGLRAEGSAGNLELYIRRWLAEHDAAWLDATDPHDASAALSWGDAQARWEARWAPLPVWVVTFEVTQAYRYLAPAGRRHGADEHGHTGDPRAAIDDQPILDDAEDGWVTSDAARREHDELDARARILDVLSAEERMVAARAQAKRLRIDAGGEMRYLDGMLRRFGPDHRDTVAQLERVERAVRLRPAA